jgi:hypothetical protein
VVNRSIEPYRIRSDGSLKPVGSPIGDDGTLAADPTGSFLYQIVGNDIVGYLIHRTGVLQLIGAFPQGVSPTVIDFLKCDMRGQGRRCRAED